MRLLNKVAIVTGASKGIGRAIALGMAQEGARVVINYCQDEKGGLSAAEQIQRSGGRALAFRADVRRVSEIDLMVEATIKEFGRIDVLVNNAAIPGWRLVFEVTEEDWNRVLETNLKGPFFLAISAARYMKNTGGGSIINVSSTCAKLAVPHLAAYTASKGGLEALTRQLARELAPFKIRVNSFGPGATLVARNLNDDPDYDARWGEVIPLGRTALPEEMISAAVFLASDESSFITGQTFYVDGGWTISGWCPGSNEAKRSGA